MKRWIGRLFPIFLLVLGLGLRVTDPGPVQQLRLTVFDQFQRIKPRAYEPAPVRILDIDDASLERLGQWPWPRTLVARLVTRLQQLGAAAIAFDIVFAEPDRTSPSQILLLWPQTPEIMALRRNPSRIPDNDRILAESIAGAGNVVTGFVLTQGELNRAPAQKKGFAFGGDDPHIFIPQFSGAVTDLPEIEKAAAGNGSFNMMADRDGIVRRAPTVLAMGETLYPTLAMEALRIAQGGGPSYLVKASGASGELSMGAQTGINHVRVGAFTVPTSADGSIWIHYTDAVPERYIPVWKVFEKDFPADAVQGMILLIGTSAAGLKDQRPTPLNPVAAGVEVHAQILEQITTGHFLERPDWATGAEILYLLVIGTVLLILLKRLGALWCALIALTTSGAAFGFSWYAYDQQHWLLDPVFPTIFVLLIYLVQSLSNFLRTEAEKRQVRGAFGRYLSPALVERLAQNPEQLQLGGEIKNMTLLFCDVRGFTTISEQFDAHGLTRFMNRYLTPMTDIILRNAGTIDKYMGDAIMAFWNAPLDDPEHATHACQAAMAMMAELNTLNETWREDAEREGRKHIPVRIGVGLNSGDCCVGNMGSDQRFDYSVLGDDVNLASRLEGQSKTYGVGIVIGENTYAQVPGYATLELDLIQVKGKTKPVHIYTLMGDPARAQDPAFKALAEKHAGMLNAYRAQDFAAAERLIRECREMAKGELDGLYDLYDERIATYRENAPEPGWDGVYIAKTK